MPNQKFRSRKTLFALIVVAAPFLCLGTQSSPLPHVTGNHFYYKSSFTSIPTRPPTFLPSGQPSSQPSSPTQTPTSAPTPKRILLPTWAVALIIILPILCGLVGPLLLYKVFNPKEGGQASPPAAPLRVASPWTKFRVFFYLFDYKSSRYNSAQEPSAEDQQEEPVSYNFTENALLNSSLLSEGEDFSIDPEEIAPLQDVNTTTLDQSTRAKRSVFASAASRRTPENASTRAVTSEEPPSPEPDDDDHQLLMPEVLKLNI